MRTSTERLSLETIGSITRRLPSTPIEHALVNEFIALCHRKGRDLSYANVDSEEEDVRALGEEGFFILSSRMLAQEFCFVKKDAGRSIFGRQKAIFDSYVAELDTDEWLPGPSFKRFHLAITSIGNVYRGHGHR